MTDHISQTKGRVNTDDLLKQATLEIRRLRNELKEKNNRLENNCTDKIAIVGMGCRFPGKVNTPEELWQFLSTSGDGIIKVPEDRWNDRALDEPLIAGGFLENIKGFDASFFNISPREAEQMDPQQRLLLEVCHESLEHSGIPSEQIRGSNTGVFIGACFDDYSQRNIRSGNPDLINIHSVLGNNRSIAAGRIAYGFDLKGPVIQLDTTCSSSLVAIHLAAQSLQNGESDLALAGGVNLMLSEEATISLRKLMALSSDGQCRTFDEYADGYSRGEGCGIVVLKRLSDAISNGDKVWAVIEGSAINHDGASNGLTAPNGKAQAKVISQALDNADLKPEQIQYVEVHGTATPIGDPIEIQALASVHTERKDSLLVGSIKTNIGHLESAAGIAGLMKTVLALEYGALPAHRNLQTLSSRIPWNKLPIKVVEGATPWPDNNEARYAGISSFGMSGTNAHLILRNGTNTDAITPSDLTSPTLFCLSAKSSNALQDVIGNYLELISKQSTDLNMLAYSMSMARNHYKIRCAVVASNKSELVQALEKLQQRSISQDKQQNLINSSTHDANDSSLYELASAYERGEDIDFRKLWAETKFSKIVLPNYPFQRSEYWQAPEAKNSGTSIPNWPGENTLAIANDINLFDSALIRSKLNWRDHQIAGQTLLPAAFYLYILPSLANQLGIFKTEVSDLKIIHPVWFNNELEADDIRILSHWENISKLKTNVSEWQVKLYHNEIKIASAIVKEADAYVENIEINKPLKSSSELDQTEFYQSFEDNGIQYGDDFRWLSKIFFDDQHAESIIDASKLTRLMNHDAQDLIIGIIDAGLQTVGVHLKNDGHSYLPISIDSFSVSNLDKLSKTSTIRTKKRTSENIHAAKCFDLIWLNSDSDQPIISLQGLRLKSFDMQADKRNEKLVPDYYSIEWVHQPLHLPKSQLGATDLKKLITAKLEKISEKEIVYKSLRLQSLLNEICILSLVRALNELSWNKEIAIASNLEDLSKRLNIKDDQHKLFKCLLSHYTSYLAIGKKFDALKKIKTSTSQDIKWEHLQKEYPEFDAQISLAKNCGDNLAKVLKGDVNPLDILFPNGDLSLLTDLYEKSPGAVVMNDLLSHSFDRLLSDLDPKTPIKILELGAGTGGTTSHILKVISQHNLNYEYHFTDISQHFLNEAKDKFSDVENMTYRLVNIEDEIDDEDKESFDIVIAANVLHATQRMDNTLKNVNSLIKPEGSIFLLEATESAVWLDMVFGMMSGWWQVKDPYRKGYPLMSIRQWHSCLDKAGLTQSAILTGEISLPQAVIMATKPKRTACWNLICEENDELIKTIFPSKQNKIDLHLSEKFSIQNSFDGLLFKVPEIYDIQNIPKQVKKLNHRLLKILQKCLKNNKPKNLCFLLDDRQAGFEIAQKSIWAWVQTLNLEHPELKTKVIIIDSTQNLNTEYIVEDIISKTNELHIYWHNGQRKVARLRKDIPQRLQLDNSSTLEGICWEDIEIHPPGVNEVQINMRASGLNYRDLLIALGQYPEPAELGSELSGIVTAVGDDITQFKVGDEVMAIAPNSFNDSVCVSEELITKIPSHIDYAAAASLPIAFITASYSLITLANIQAGNTVLINNAAGGVGQAAIQICQSVRANVIATASKKKHEVLKTLGVKEIYDSRSIDFVEQIIDKYKQPCIDVVISALPEPYQTASLKLLKTKSSYIDIGKGSSLSDEEFVRQKPELQLYRVDIAKLCRDNPSLIQKELKQLGRFVEMKRWRPISHTEYEQSEIQLALRKMQKAEHTGKLVIKGKQKLTSHKKIKTHKNKTYLITGGLGGIGLSIAKWLINSGAKNICLTSRHLSSDNLTFKQLESFAESESVNLSTRTVDVCDEKAISDLISFIQKSDAPLCGVLHAAGTLHDTPITQLDKDAFDEVAAPKIKGAWILHELTKDLPLDDFMLFSSATAITGSPGQANHAVANAFLDGLADYRNRHRLPAVSICWGAWSEIGAAVKYQDKQNIRGLPGIGMITPSQGMDEFEKIWPNKYGRYVVIPIDWKRASKLDYVQHQCLYENLRTNFNSSNDDTVSSSNDEECILKTKLQALSTPEQLDYINSHLQSLVAQALGISLKEVSPDIGLFEMGLDSLTAMELKNRLQHELDITLPTTILFDYPTINRLSEFLQLQIGVEEFPTQAKSNPIENSSSQQKGVTEKIPALINADDPSISDMENYLDQRMDQLEEWLDTIDEPSTAVDKKVLNCE